MSENTDRNTIKLNRRLKSCCSSAVGGGDVGAVATALATVYFSIVCLIEFNGKAFIAHHISMAGFKLLHR